MYSQFCLLLIHVIDLTNMQMSSLFYSKGGIRSKNLTIALEPEAASMYCKKIQLVKLSEAKSDKEGFDIFSPGNQYLILDAGGMPYI